jgi:hypothetical protein
VQGVLILLGVLHESRIERHVVDHPAGFAETEADVAAWGRHGGFATGPEKVAVNRNTADLEEDRHAWMTARGTGPLLDRGFLA